MAAATTLLIHTRAFTTTAAALGKRNFRKFLMYGKRGTKIQKERMSRDPSQDPELSRAHGKFYLKVVIIMN